ncbi:YadA-like family protein [Stenotrophomonas maltophilia]|uniref:YadA-like family protein n=1 Tax=Stenotrophomonas maltophilia TaxID=40324 RepID=UPI0013FE1774|nr:YadA-like family protein [Stenotrophomonas maltophilia]
MKSRLNKSRLAIAAIALLSSGLANASLIKIGDGAAAAAQGDVAIGDLASATTGMFQRMTWNGSSWDIENVTATAVSIGKQSKAIAGGVAIGEQSEAASASVSIGSKAIATQQGGVAIGENAQAKDQNTIAIGPNAKATANGAVAIGANTIADQYDTVAVGGGLPEGKRIVGVAKGVGDYDAVNVKQLNETVAAGTGSKRIVVNGPETGGAARAIGSYDIAIGTNAETQFDGSEYGPNIAVGRNSKAYYGSTVIGDNASAGRKGVAIGNGAYAGGVNDGGGVAIGRDSRVESNGVIGGNGVAIGPNTIVTGGATAAIGPGARADAPDSIAIGGSTGGRANTVAFGNRQLTGVNAGTADTDAVNLKQLNDALAGIPTTPGAGNPYFAAKGDLSKNDPALAIGDNSVAGGPSARAAGNQSSAYGSNANANGEGSTAAGNQANAYADQSTAVGAFSSATAKCTAVGYGAECSEDGTVSFGRSGDDKRLKNVAGGIEDTDAANTGQVRAVDLRVRQTQTAVSRQAVWFGGGASYDPTTGVWTNPNFAMPSGPSFNNVNDALVYLDNRIGNGTSPGTGPQGPAGADGRSAYEVAVGNGYKGTEKEWLASLKGADGKDGVGGGSSSKSVAGKNIEVSDNQDGTQTVAVADNVVLSENGSVKVGATTVDAKGVSIEGGASMTRDGINAGNQRVTSVAAGRIEKGSTDAVNGGQIYDMQTALNDRWDETNRRIDRQDRRIDAMGAQVAAMSMMAAANVPAAVGEVQASAGIGFSGNEGALAIGWRARITERTSVSGGFSYSARGKAMGGVGVSINLGR